MALSRARATEPRPGLLLRPCPGDQISDRRVADMRITHPHRAVAHEQVKDILAVGIRVVSMVVVELLHDVCRGSFETAEEDSAKDARGAPGDHLCIW